MPGNLLRPVVQETTPSLLARQLRQAIGAGELVPGQQLNEMELSRALGVSRGPLREAMQRLTQEGLLVSVRNRGVFVIEVTDDDVRDMYLARTALERAAAAHAAETDPAAAQEQLLRIVQEMEDAAGRGDLVAVTESDIDFHTTLVSLAHSPRLTRMHTTLMVETRMCITALEQRYSSQSPRLQEHRHIAEAIGRADLAGLDRLLVGHMEDAIGRLVAALD